jgi:hypothetical protein
LIRNFCPFSGTLGKNTKPLFYEHEKGGKFLFLMTWSARMRLQSSRKGIAIDYLRNALSKIIEKYGHLVARDDPNFLALEYEPLGDRNLGYGILTVSVKLLYQRRKVELHPETLRPT